MPPRDWEFRLEDILEAIRKIERYTTGLDLDSFRADDRTRDAVIWNLILIGEASRLVPDEVAELAPNVPWAQMRGMRNVLVHEYFGVDETIVWTTATRDLPPLIDPLEMILAREADD